MIKLKNVNKYYKSGNDLIHVIKDLNYTFPDTGLVFILGPSGSGKSTLLNLLGGLDKPDSGEILIENKNLSKFSKSDLNNYLNSYLGFVFQEYNILKDLNLYQNISLSLEMQGKRRVKKAVKEIIEKVGLSGLEKRKVNQLSGGQKQRIAIARALVKNPNLIIADEPTGNLDTETSTSIFNLFKELSKDRLIIIVTHDEESAYTYADDIIKFDVASVDEQSTTSVITQNEEITETTKKLKLKKSRTPLKTISKLSFKKLWQKKFRHLLVMIINIVTLAFLAFAIELNGDKLYQNVYTTVNNSNNYTDIYQSDGITNPNDFYAQYQKTHLESGSYENIKSISSDLTLHKYQNISINYAGYTIDRANFLYSGYLNTVIYFDETNTYNLLSGTLPSNEKPEILITDYLFDAFKYFKLFDSSDTIYSVIGTPIDLGIGQQFIITGVVESNYKNWLHLSRLSSSYKYDKYDEEMQGFDYDYAMMNAIIVGDSYYKYVIDNSFLDIESTIAEVNLAFDAYRPYAKSDDNNLMVGRAPESENEIVLPYNLIIQVCSIRRDFVNWDRYYQRYYLQTTILNNSNRATVEFVVNLSDDEESSHSRKLKIVGFTYDTSILTSEETHTSISNIIKELASQKDSEKILVELSTDPKVVLNQFNTLFNSEKHYVIDVFKYKDAIESFSVSPIVNFISKGGLIVFTVLAIGIMWTIISLEIVDSKKEIGILRSIGLSGTKVSTIFLIQTLLVNILSYFISLPIAKEIVNSYGGNLTDPLGEIKLTMYTMTNRSPIILMIFIVVMTIISTIIPLIKIISNKIINIINERN